MISHGHIDYCGGLKYFLKKNQNAEINIRPQAEEKQFTKRLPTLRDVLESGSFKLRRRRLFAFNVEEFAKKRKNTKEIRKHLKIYHG